MSATVETNASAQDIAVVQAGLRQFNIAFIGDPHEEAVNVFVRDENGGVVGGLLGHIKWKWLYVSKLWISDEHRGRGHGVDLMKAAEDYARSRGCIGSYLDTFEYQARPFYEKIGYEMFGTLEGYPPGYRQFFLSKSL
ncbi:MAG TPA: GNAT family N-acetyltransferase [Gemmatimonadaceae bacterium]|nr:GNAT family N-acetyltransferase [Gemmatimonadaceae bacterium]